LVEAIREHISDWVAIRELDTHINDPGFAVEMANVFHKLYTAWAEQTERTIA
jgi:hypothetical protein